VQEVITLFTYMENYLKVGEWMTLTPLSLAQEIFIWEIKAPQEHNFALI